MYIRFVLSGLWCVLGTIVLADCIISPLGISSLCCRWHIRLFLSSVTIAPEEVNSYNCYIMHFAYLYRPTD